MVRNTMFKEAVVIQTLFRVDDDLNSTTSFSQKDG